MSNAASRPAEIVPLAWDTQQFGFPVARLQAAGLATSEIECLIGSAQAAGIEMLVVTMGAQEELAEETLYRFGGILADDKVTFERRLADDAPLRLAASTDRYDEQACIGPCELDEYLADERLAAELLGLSLASGQYSRFRVDRRFPRSAFETLYRLWIERSVRRELADVVLVARAADRHSALAGMITVAVAGQVGTIGLVAVAEAARGQGIGTRLIEAAHNEMRRRGAGTARVVTQLVNRPACGLYRRAGYRLAATERIYHFWPRRAAAA